ncbi:hypothetical protein B9J78_04400 [bacterium Unc6]|nr:hypothetical protein [bacterium Unc6]MBT9131250.1 hypothetical protein [Candidatus Psychracetigena formicireducens]
MIDKEFVKQKAELIHEDLELLTEFKSLTFEELVSENPIRWNGIQHLLQKVIGRGIDINQHLIAETAESKLKAPQTYTETFLALEELGVLPENFAQEIARSAGFRNALVHEYNNLDEHIIYKTMGEAIEQYTKYCDYILKFIES